MTAQKHLDEALASMTSPRQREHVLRLISGILEKALESWGGDLRPQVKRKRLAEQVEAWIASGDDDAFLPLLDDVAQSELRRLLDITTIHTAVCEVTDDGGRDTWTSCEFSIGGWRSELSWRYNYPQHRADVYSGPDLDEWGVAYAYHELPNIPQSVFAAIPTTLPHPALAYYIYLLGFEHGEDPDDSPSWDVEFTPLVDLNTADAKTLGTLPGLSTAKGELIVVHRELHGPFQSASELTRLRGIGARTVEGLKDRVICS